MYYGINRGCIALLYMAGGLLKSYLVIYVPHFSEYDNVKFSHGNIAVPKITYTLFFRDE